MAVIAIGNNLLQSNLSLSSIIIFSICILGYALSHFVNVDTLTILLPISILFSSILTFALSTHYLFRQIMLFGGTCIQAINLLIHLALRIDADKQDRRLKNIRNNEWNRLSFFLGMAAMAFCYCLPLTIVGSIKPSVQTNLTSTDIAGTIMWVLGFAMECASNNQLFAFTHDPHNYGKICMAGLWKYMRHPNYIGNVMQVISYFLLSSSAAEGMEWIGILFSVIFLSSMLLFVSGIPPVEKQMEDSLWASPGYLSYKRSTGRYLPFKSIIKAFIARIFGLSNTVYNSVPLKKPSLPSSSSSSSTSSSTTSHVVENRKKEKEKRKHPLASFEEIKERKPSKSPVDPVTSSGRSKLHYESVLAEAKRMQIPNNAGEISPGSGISARE